MFFLLTLATRLFRLCVKCGGIGSVLFYFNQLYRILLPRRNVIDVKIKRRKMAGR